jgi:hypothetical protein
MLKSTSQRTEGTKEDSEFDNIFKIAATCRKIFKNILGKAFKGTVSPGFL